MGFFFSEAEIRVLAGLRARGAKPAGLAYSRLRETEKPFYFYGAGKRFQRLAPFLLDGLLPCGASGILDNDPALIGALVGGLRVFHPGDPEIAASKPMVVITVFAGMSQSEINADCERRGYEYVTADALELMLYSPAEPQALEGNPECLAALGVWDDSESCAVYRGVIRARATLDELDLPPLETHHGQYFPPDFDKSRFSRFVDAGAYIGDTLRQFRAEIGDDYEAYHAFEADPENFSRLLREAGGDARVHCRDEVLLDKKGLVSFAGGNGGSSHVLPGGDGGRRADSLDNLLAGQPVTLIKMDIEGSEPLALEGARKIIGAQRPALAVCTYHALEQQWGIPLWLKRQFPFYRLRLRRHGIGVTETVCYAIP